MKNDYKVNGSITTVYLKPKSGKVFEILIDTSQLERVQELKNFWYPSFMKKAHSTYVVGRFHKNDGHYIMLLHRFLTNPKKEEVVDHINGNTLDNRLSNLRVCDHVINGLNRNITKSNTGVLGVTWKNRDKRFQAMVTINGKNTYLGYFKTIESAKRVVEQARRESIIASVQQFEFIKSQEIII